MLQVCASEALPGMEAVSQAWQFGHTVHDRASYYAAAATQEFVAINI